MEKIGLKTLIFGFLFWYGLGYLNPIVLVNPVSFEVNFSIALFFAVMVLLHRIGYSFTPKGFPQLVPFRDYRVGSRTFTLLAISLLLGAILLLFSQGGGMLGYHALRAQIALGILTFIYVLLFKGWQRTFLFLAFLAIAFYSLDTYSRRPFLTLVAPVLLVPLIRNRYNVSSRLLYGIVGSTVVIAAISYLTGIRALPEEGSLFDVVNVVMHGLSILAVGEGIDTVHLTAYIVDNYHSSTYLYGQTFIAGIVNFIPRAFWWDKPVAFGMTLSGQYFDIGLDEIFTNFGPGIVSESYANGGFIAIVFVASLLGLLIGMADRAIENNRYDWNYVLFGVVLYPAIFFMVRGDFVNSFYELYSKAIVIWALCAVTGLRHRLKPAYIKQC